MPAQELKFNPVNINLLPGANEFEKTRIGKIIKWSLSVGRIIVVFTELIVILAFLSRFKLDKDLTDLHESIEQKKVIIENAKNLEKNFLLMQERINKIPLLESEQAPFDILISDIANSTPIDVFVQRLSFTKGRFTVTGTSLSEAGLATLIYQLRNSPKFTEITFDSINKKKGAPDIQFSLSATLTPEAFKI